MGRDMNLRAVLTLEYVSEDEAKAVAGALHPDNEDYVKTTLEGGVLKAVVSSDSASGLRHTLDDFLACLKVAEDAVGIKRAEPSKEV
jgi:tRNA threonylcarbamoyladenosine modification (KEOPS) complex  Pcc1 subunit